MYLILQMPQIVTAKKKMIASGFDIEELDSTMRTFFRKYFDHVTNLESGCGAEHK